MKKVTIEIPDDYEVCPHCQGIYNPKAGESHSPLDKDICELIIGGSSVGYWKREK